MFPVQLSAYLALEMPSTLAASAGSNELPIIMSARRKTTRTP